VSVLVNHELSTRTDYTTTAASYRQMFNANVSLLAKHFKGRVKYWEVWNEPNVDELAKIDTLLYAPLLNDAYNTIKQVTPTNQVLFGGLGSPWFDSLFYLRGVYDVPGTAKPFDIFALHSYPHEVYGKPPQTYMHHLSQLQEGDKTVFDKFITELIDRQEGYKKLWITEIGWNSNSKQDPTANPNCRENVAVTRLDQALYLKPGFDIIRTEVKNNPVQKVFWFQYRDTNNDRACLHLPDTNASWWYGLYDGDSQPTKTVLCAFQAYPLACDRLKSVYIPLITREEPPILRPSAPDK
jgi:hypothetical protein